jgi:hypothetical protein
VVLAKRTLRLHTGLHRKSKDCPAPCEDTASGQPIAAPLDADLDRLLTFWPDLPEPLRNALAHWLDLPQEVRDAALQLLCSRGH